MAGDSLILIDDFEESEKKKEDIFKELDNAIAEGVARELKVKPEEIAPYIIPSGMIFEMASITIPATGNSLKEYFKAIEKNIESDVGTLQKYIWGSSGVVLPVLSFIGFDYLTGNVFRDEIQEIVVKFRSDYNYLIIGLSVIAILFAIYIGVLS